MAHGPRYVKICGITRPADAVLCVEAGASAIGLNFVPTSRRRIDVATARRIVEVVAGRVEVVAVVADETPERLEALRAATGIQWLQLHGHESPELFSRVPSPAFKAVPIGEASDVERARAFGGERILADAKVVGATGGTGVSFDWELVRGLARDRRLVLAGGLRPDNVARAIGVVQPFGVDTASGVEASPGVKDPLLVRAFVEAARSADSS